MKSKEFKTSKGEFVISGGYDVINGGIKLSEITEDQAKEIVDEPEYLPCNNCLNGCPVCGGYGYSISFINELHSLIKSLGIHLYKNPIPPFKERINEWQEADSITFYNPYIFKKI